MCNRNVNPVVYHAFISFSIHVCKYLPGLTTRGRTWARRGVPPVFCRWSESGPVSGLMETGHRARRRSERHKNRIYQIKWNCGCKVRSSSKKEKLMCTVTHENSSHLAINDSREGQVVKNLSAVSPDSDWTILSEALVVEAIHLGDLPRLVVSPDQGYPVRITHLWITPDIVTYSKLFQRTRAWVHSAEDTCAP